MSTEDDDAMWLRRYRLNRSFISNDAFKMTSNANLSV